MMQPAVTIALAAMLCAAAPSVVRAQGATPPAQPPQGQAPPAAPKPQPPRPAAAAPAPAPARASAAVTVTDQSGNPLSEVHVTLTGPVSREGTTGRDGMLRLQGLRPGNYRLRFQAPEFVTLELESTLKATGNEIDVALSREAPRPKVADPQPPPVPAPTAGTGAVAPDPNATVDTMALPDWIERNLIGRSDPLKESTVGKTPATTATVVQVREPLKDRVRNDADEMLYVIAGQGVLRSKGREVSLDAGAFVVVPRGVGYSIERRGRNPLIALSIVGK
jgi:mannose-6-phosphate isomerase-like protein (cupin superfamily)